MLRHSCYFVFVLKNQVIINFYFQYLLHLYLHSKTTRICIDLISIDINSISTQEVLLPG